MGAGLAVCAVWIVVEVRSHTPLIGVLGSLAGRVERRFTSRRALVAGAAISAVASRMIDGLPALTGFTATFAMAALFLGGCAVAGLLIPAPAPVAASWLPAASSETS